MRLALVSLILTSLDRHVDECVEMCVERSAPAADGDD